MFNGIGTALITPLNEDLSIDYDLFTKLCIEQSKQNVAALFVHGTTGAGSTLSLEEKLKLLNIVANNVSDKCLIYTSISNNDTLKAIEEVTYLKKYAQRIDGMLLLTPFYNKANDQGIYQHLTQITKAANLPTIVYHIPSRCGVGINSKVLSKIVKNPLITGIKYADNNLEYLQEILLNYQNENFKVYLGEDALYYVGVKMGVDGLISASTNVLLKQYQLIAQNNENSKKLFKEILPLVQTLFLDVNPICITYLYAQINHKQAHFRLPLCMPSEEVQLKLKSLGQKYASSN